MNDELGNKLTRLAEGVLDELLAGGETPLDQRIDAIKAIGTLHLGLKRLSGKMPLDEEDAASFAAMRKRVREAGEGK